jgi:glucan phosphoethanolaminetransferase (alkaline phosphatase superfamily)
MDWRRFTKISGRARWALYGAQLAALSLLIAVTNPGVAERLGVLTAHDAKWFVVVLFLALWGIGLAGVVSATLIPNAWLRGFWALTIAASAAVGYGFYAVSQTELSLYDVVSLWNARHEAGRAFAFYQASLFGAAVIFVLSLAFIAVPPPPMPVRIRRWARYLVIVPALPIAIYAALIMSRGGDGSRALPAQFTPVSIGALAGAKIATNTMPQRDPVAWKPAAPLAKHIVLLVDESIRADYIDWRDNNPNTPEIARNKKRMVDFGPAASGGNCSHYSNAILRFGGARHDLTRTMLRNATLWQYARQAGYRTVFIDGQAGFMRNGGYSGKFQNFMSAEEAAWIDDFHALSGEAPALDDKLIDIVLKDLRGDQPVFIYAVKNGAHFPYDNDYPAAGALFRPTMSEQGLEDAPARVNSYRNAVRWNVDRIFKRLFDEANLRDTAIIYTSDHGQNLDPKKLTHCTIEDPAPSEGLVPLIAITDDARLKARFVAAARDSFGYASHFTIAPTLLQLFGYPRGEVVAQYGGSMFDRVREPTAFTSGDVFGLFSDKVRWHPIDLTAIAAGQARAEAPPQGKRTR